MKNNNFTLTFKSDNKSYSIRIPRHYEKLMNNAYCAPLGDNGMRTLCKFCSKYENLGKAKQEKLQQIIDSGLITFKLKTFYDLYVLTCTIDGFQILKGVATPKQLANYYYDTDCNDAKRDGAILHNRLGGAFYKGDYYYYLQN